MNRLGIILKSFAGRIGMDKAIAYASGARIVQSAAGVVIVFLIASFLTAEEQGYYFTFNSVLSIQTFFELGFTTIITQFVAYEASQIKINIDNTLEGEHLYRSRLSSLLRFSLKWYSIASSLFLIIVITVGFLFFRGEEDGVSWKVPWILICVSTSIKMIQSPISAILMGLGKVTEMNKVIFFQQFLCPLFTCIGLICHWKLYVIGLSSCLSVFIWFYYVRKTSLFNLLVNVFRQDVDERVDYIKEIFPYQWRIAISSLSGYFIFHFLTPILFKYQGAIVAGQVGLSISMISAVQSLSMSWLNTKTPIYSRLIALKQYTELDKLFNKTMKQMLSVCSVLLALLFVFLNALSLFKVSFNGSLLSDRFLTGLPLVFLMIAYFTDQFTFSWASYLRCHKKEPFLWLSLVNGILCLLSIFISAKYSTVLIIMISYAVARMIVLPWGYSIFINKKKEWHK